MKKEKMYVPSGLKTRDGKDIMCYTAEFYVKNKPKIDKIIKKCEEILREDTEYEENKNAQDNSKSSKESNYNNILKEDAEKYNSEIHINKKHDKLFKEILSDKREAIKFMNYYLNLSLVEDEIEKIRNAKGEDEIMTNASRIINNEMRKQRKAGIEEGKAEGRAIGRIAGIKENQEKVIRRLKLMNLSTQQIAKAVELEIKEVEKILNE